MTEQHITQFVVKEMNRINVVKTYLVQLSTKPLERHNELRSIETFRKKFTYPIPGNLNCWYKVQTYQEWYATQQLLYSVAHHQLPLEFNKPPVYDINADMILDLWTLYGLIRFDYRKQVYID